MCVYTFSFSFLDEKVLLLSFVVYRDVSTSQRLCCHCPRQTFFSLSALMLLRKHLHTYSHFSVLSSSSFLDATTPLELLFFLPFFRLLFSIIYCAKYFFCCSICLCFKFLFDAFQHFYLFYALFFGECVFLSVSLPLDVDGSSKSFLSICFFTCSSVFYKYIYAHI